MMLRARSMAHISAVKMELFIGRAFLWMVLLRTAAHAVLLISLEPSVNIYWWSGWCKKIVWNFSSKVLACVFVLGSLFNWRITCGFLMIQGGICGRVLLCTFVTEIADSWRIGSIRKPNSLIFFLFVHIVVCIYSWRCSRKLGWMGRISVLCNTAEPIFHIWASVYKLTTGEVLKAPKTRLKPSWWIGSSFLW